MLRMRAREFVPRLAQALGAALGVTLGSTLAVACGGTEPPTTPPECDAPPRYAADIQPIVERLCLRCHSEMVSGGARNNAPVELNYDRLESFADTSAKASFVDAITSGRQPPPTAMPATPSTPDERATASAWQTCGYLP